MYEKRERQRLNELFSGIERPELNPAVDVLVAQLPELEAPPAGITELEKPFLDYPVAVVDVEPEPPVRLQLEAQSPEVFILNEPKPAVLTPAPELEQQQPVAFIAAETESTAMLQPVHPLAALPDSVSSLPAFSKVITSPLNNDARNSNMPGKPLTEAELSLLTWQAVGIGILIGGLATGIVLALTAHLDVFGTWGRYALAGGEVLFATLGALFNISSRKTKRALWIGAAGWSLIPILAAIVFLLLLTMVMFTNFFGV